MFIARADHNALRLNKLEAGGAINILGYSRLRVIERGAEFNL
jgi:hypothetical protein